MKRYFLLLLSVLLIFPQILHGEKVSGDDARITYIGRTLVKDGEVSFDWTGVYLKARFQGTYLEMKVSDTGNNYYNVWLDSPMDADPDKAYCRKGQRVFKGSRHSGNSPLTGYSSRLINPPTGS